MEQDPVILPLTDNLRALVHGADDNPRAVIIHVQAKEREEPVSFQVTTSATIISHFWELPQLEGGNWLTVAGDVRPDRYRIMIDRSFLDQPVIIGLELATSGDPVLAILAVEPWDGVGGTSDVVYIE